MNEPEKRFIPVLIDSDLALDDPRARMKPLTKSDGKSAFGVEIPLCTLREAQDRLINVRVDGQALDVAIVEVKGLPLEVTHLSGRLPVLEQGWSPNRGFTMQLDGHLIDLEARERFLFVCLLTKSPSAGVAHRVTLSVSKDNVIKSQHVQEVQNMLTARLLAGVGGCAPVSVSDGVERYAL